MRSLFLFVLAFISLALVPGSISGAQEIDFNRDIKPILSENCYFCHGPDAGDRKAKLRLDTFEGATAEVVVPGKPEESEFVHRIFTDDGEERMPPPEAKIALSEEEKNLLKQWIESGAEYKEHWAFVPPEKAKLRGDSHPIDQLVNKALSARGMKLAPEADRFVLIRRVALDLTGFPPSPEMVKEFLRDEKPGAYERLVDRLLASPSYGERMAWDWLDAARYADSNGYQGDNERTMWPWRDWVVKAFNENLPYDKFTLWQLAGDLLPDATDEMRLATGFCRNHPINGEGGRISEENRVDYVMDMTETMGTVWLGLTLNCCRCHDHKFDPLPQKDYYQLSDYFNQTPVDGGGRSGQTAPILAVHDQSQKIELARLNMEVSAAEQELKDITAQVKHERSENPPENQWRRLQVKSASAEKQTLAVQDGELVLASGENPANDTYTLRLGSPIASIGSIRLDALRHKTMTGGGLSRSDSGNFVLTEIEVSVKRAGKDEAELVKINAAEATFEQGSLKIAGTFDGKKTSGWAVYEGRNIDRDHTGIWRFEKPVSVAEGDELIVVLRHDSKHPQHVLGHFRLSIAADREAGFSESEDPRISKAKKTRDDLKSRRDSLQRSAPKVMVMADMSKRRKTYILDSGLYSKHGAEVFAGVPEALHPMPDGYPNNRLGLARWLVAPENPLTARVTVNRFWQQIFGIGLVKTAEDFGAQGELPPQQELLDWLAVDFRESGWDVKRLMKLIVTSRAYKQTAKSAEGYREDPENRWLARGPRFRMPSWMLRDNALAASGLLVEKQGGRPLNPYQPAGIWEETSYGKKKYSQDSGDDLYRRSLYTFWRRIAPPTAFFDNAGRQVCQVNPVRTNTPLHALYTLNDVTFVEASRVLAGKAMKSHPDSESGRFSMIFERILARPPGAAEVATLTEVLVKTRKHYEESPEEARKFLSEGESPRDESLDAVEHASWTALCLAVFNFDEAVTKP